MPRTSKPGSIFEAVEAVEKWDRFCNARISRDRSRAHFECRPQTFTENLDQKLKLFLCILISSELISFQTRFSFERIDIAGMGRERIGRFCDSTYILEQFLENSLTPMSKFSLQWCLIFYSIFVKFKLLILLINQPIKFLYQLPSFDLYPLICAWMNITNLIKWCKS